MNYRPAEARDVGRTDVEVSDDGKRWSGPRELTRVYLESQAYPVDSFLTASGATWRFARVPILPEECEHHYGLGSVCRHCGIEWPPPAKLERLGSKQVKVNYRSKLKPMPMDYPGEVLSVQHIEGSLTDDEMTCLASGRALDPERYHKRVTIRRKLEAGGQALPEEAVLIEGKFYTLAWIKSSPGINPEQCEVV